MITITLNANDTNNTLGIKSYYSLFTWYLLRGIVRMADNCLFSNILLLALTKILHTLDSNVRFLNGHIIAVVGESQFGR